MKFRYRSAISPLFTEQILGPRLPILASMAVAERRSRVLSADEKCCPKHWWNRHCRLEALALLLSCNSPCNSASALPNQTSDFLMKSPKFEWYIMILIVLSHDYSIHPSYPWLSSHHDYQFTIIILTIIKSPLLSSHHYKDYIRPLFWVTILPSHHGSRLTGEAHRRASSPCKRCNSFSASRRFFSASSCGSCDTGWISTKFTWPWLSGLGEWNMMKPQRMGDWNSGSKSENWPDWYIGNTRKLMDFMAIGKKCIDGFQAICSRSIILWHHDICMV